MSDELEKFLEQKRSGRWFSDTELSWQRFLWEKLSWEKQSEEKKLEENRLKHRSDLRVTPNINQPSPLLPRNVPTLKAFKKLPANPAFIALETRHNFSGDIRDIGLALLPQLELQTRPDDEIPDVQRFAERYHAIVSSARVTRDPAILPRCHNYFHWNPLYAVLKPYHRRFDREIHVADLESDLNDVFREFRGVVKHRNLILVGFNMQEKFDLMTRLFPSIIRHFDYWIDLTALMKSSDSAWLKPWDCAERALKAFGHHDRDIHPSGRHRAVNNALRTLAVLEGAIYPKPYRMPEVPRPSVPSASTFLRNVLRRQESRRNARSLQEADQNLEEQQKQDSADTFDYEHRAFPPKIHKMSPGGAPQAS
ncbi:hypothetical protein GGR54DRAFT_621529 [Hypoxylon sp. NC1633]|nr:hypothetical protein GGR54DRAFT_621529 [Hypoxylon sp. NC1633]